MMQKKLPPIGLGAVAVGCLSAESKGVCFFFARFWRKLLIFLISRLFPGAFVRSSLLLKFWMHATRRDGGQLSVDTAHPVHCTKQ